MNSNFCYQEENHQRSVQLGPVSAVRDVWRQWKPVPDLRNNCQHLTLLTRGHTTLASKKTPKPKELWNREEGTALLVTSLAKSSQNNRKLVLISRNRILNFLPLLSILLYCTNSFQIRKKMAECWRVRHIQDKTREIATIPF